MANKDYYSILGVSKNASDSEIKKIFVSWQRNIIPMYVKIKMQKKNLKK